MFNIYKRVYSFFDKLEDKVRGKLTHYPLVYAFLGSIGIVSIWRGIWVISDNWQMSGELSLAIGVILTMLTGLFVSFFIGENIIISGLNNEKKIEEKTEREIHKERNLLAEIRKDIKEIRKILDSK